MHFVRLCFIAPLLAVWFTALPAAGQQLFGTREVRNANIAPFTKWTGELARELRERAQYGQACATRRAGRCHVSEWRGLLEQLRGQDPMRQLDAVNRFMNRQPYVEDMVNYGVVDHWATPLEFFARDGDCEDYAIGKYHSLRELGWPASQLRILVLNDLNLRVPHAVLIAYVGGRAFMLDNQFGSVVPVEVIRHYQPIFSINEEAWWLHQR
jgi:predicted transglutaminase-like cysteine proteinase